MVTVRTMEELKATAFVKLFRPVTMCWADKGQTRTTKSDCNTGAVIDNEPKLEDWEYKLAVNKYLRGYKMYKEGTKAWVENKCKCYYLILQQCPPELKTELNNSAWWKAATTNTDAVALLLIFWDVMHNKRD